MVGTPPACATEPLRATGTIFYYCECGAGADAACIPGDNTVPSCTDPGHPCSTGAQAKFKSISGGQTVALCRGGSFSFVATYTNNAACSANSTCDLRDYTDSRFTLADPASQATRPLIYGPIFRPNSYYTSASSAGFRFFNLQNKVGHPQLGSFTGGDANGGAPVAVNDVDICNVFFADMEMAVFMSPVDARWRIRNSQFARIGGNALLGACQSCEIDNNYFASSSYGDRDYRDHPIYVSAHRSTAGMRITNNEVHGCPSPAKAPSTGTPLIVVHGNTSGLVIENNLIQCDHPEAIPTSSMGGPQNQFGIQVNSGGYAEPEAFPRTIIRRNRVIANATGIEIDMAPDSIVEANVVELMPRYPGYGIEVKSSKASPATTNAIVRNNTVYAPAAANPWYTGISVRAGASLPSGATVTNNVVFGATASQVRCFDLQSMSYGLLSNNACNGTWNTTLDTNRIALSGSPFAVVGSDYTPAADSPLVAAGTPASYSALACGNVGWSPMDSGKLRDAPPDVGAFER